MASTDWTRAARSGYTSSITPLGRTSNGTATGLPNQTHGDAFDEYRFIGQIQGNTYTQNQVGQIQNLHTVSLRTNEAKPTGDGEVYIEPNPSVNSGNDNTENLLSQRSTSSFPIITGGPTNYYKMQGWYTIGSVYETWVAVGAPNTSPPSGHVLTDISVVGKWSV